MQRVTITLDDDLMAEIDKIIAVRGYQNRSEAIRDLARSGLEQAATERPGSGECVATLVYVYDHHARELSKKLTQEFHDHHDLAQATLHVHLDHDTCLEASILRGDAAEIKTFADHVIAERGVRHGHVVYVPSVVTHAPTQKSLRSSRKEHPATTRPRHGK